MKPESLKKIAEILGYKATVENNAVHYRKAMDICWFEFDPQNNPAQLLEIIEKFKMSLNWDTDKFHWVIFGEGIWIDGKTLTEAVLAAAEEFVK